jgi:hypothetical protein
MASDGDIAPEEVVYIRDLYGSLTTFNTSSFDAEIDNFVNSIEADGKAFITNYLHLLEGLQLTEQEELNLLDIVIKVIKSDNVIEYSEIKFFKTIRYRLRVSDEKITDYFADTHEDIFLFLGEDIRTDVSMVTQQYFDTMFKDLVIRSSLKDETGNIAKE